MSDIHPFNTAESIKRLRKEKNITAIELAEKMGVSPAYIARLEMGEAKPTAEQIEVIKSFVDGQM